jgi:acetyltransferase-like isoleucine patch superfamily enzyme
MTHVKALQPYIDERGNQIVYLGEPRRSRIDIKFGGSNNRLVVAPNAHVVELGVDFTGDGAIVEILPTSSPRTGLRFGIRLGHDCAVRIGENVGSQGRTMITAVEGAEVTLGDDCMLAMGIEIRSDDAHPIYDVRTGERINMGQSIAIGNHVWIAKHATIMGGVRVGDGAVIGFRSIVTSDVPNNSIAAGAPARIVRRDIAWERPMVTTRHRGDVTPRPGEKNEEFWNLTEEERSDWPDPVARPVPFEKADLDAMLAEAEAAKPTPVAAAVAAAPQTGGRIVRGTRRRVGRVLRRWGLR